MFINRKYPADFGQLEKVLKRDKSDRPVLFEYFANANLISFINNNSFAEITSRKEQINAIIRFFHATGYDHATIPARYFGAFSFQTGEQEKKSSVSLNQGAMITDHKSFENYNWPDPEQGEYNLLLKIGAELRDGMKFVVAGPGGLLENVINLAGFENLCFMIYEDEELARIIIDHVGTRLLRFYQICSSVETVGALIVNDDWGFKTQTMIPPETLRELVFPWHKKIVEAIHQNGKYAILHSCGNLGVIMDDIAGDLKYDAKHSFEDAILPVEDFWQEWHSKIAILGGIDVDFLTRSQPEKIRQRCQKILEITGLKSYALGSGNSIPEYVPVENYLSMISVFPDF